MKRIETRIENDIEAQSPFLLVSRKAEPQRGTAIWKTGVVAEYPEPIIARLPHTLELIGILLGPLERSND